jgi:hypothetical protein
MNPRTFNVGDRVVKGYLKDFTRDSRFKVGTVSSLVENTNHLYLVDWVKDYYHTTDYMTKESSEFLLLETEVQAYTSKLEADFAVVEAKIREQVDVAVAAIKQATALATAHHEDLSQLDVGYHLLGALDHAGWNISSIVC